MGTEDIPTLVALAVQTAAELEETEAHARLQLALIVAALGVEGTATLVELAKETYVGRGMFSSDGTRRTLGGTFFALVRKQMRRESKAAQEAVRAPRRKTKAAKARAQIQEIMERYRARKVELVAAREALAKEKEAREKAERELSELRSKHAKALIQGTRSSAPPPRPRPASNRVYRAFDPKG